ncbi:hypothetical protein NONI108955_25745 [Nocardia ninae]
MGATADRSKPEDLPYRIGFAGPKSDSRSPVTEAGPIGFAPAKAPALLSRGAQRLGLAGYRSSTAARILRAFSTSRCMCSMSSSTELNLR